MAEVFLILGSNKGDRHSNLSKALERIKPLFIKNYTLSGLYESEPWGFDPQTWFLNIVFRGETSLDPKTLLKELMSTEKELGRIRIPGSTGYESREIDIDIVFYSDFIIDTPDLVVPHPRMAQRLFVLVPLCEIAPAFIHPVLGKSIRLLLSECDDTSRVNRLI
jgi:2-amino-4-hydroxy-6-hydroxymethyldihydropteridine diphosphokinase